MEGGAAGSVSPKYLASINLSAGSKWEFPLKTLPRPKGRATRVIITEYDLPRPDAQVHDAIADSEGMVWYTDFGNHYVGKLDPKTAKVVEYLLPDLKPDWPKGSLDVEEDKAGDLWFGMMVQGGIAKFDKKTQKIQSWTLPPEANGDTAQVAMVMPWQQGVDGKDYRKSRDEAADAGHLAHAWIEDEIHGRSRTADLKYTADMIEKATVALDAFRRWRDQVKLEILETEVPLISEKYHFGGTFDCLGRVAGNLALVDWKTSGAVYSDHISQLGGYHQLLEERDTILEEAHLLRLGKEEADFHHHSWPVKVLDMGRKSFLMMRELYDLDAKLRKMV